LEVSGIYAEEFIARCWMRLRRRVGIGLYVQRLFVTWTAAFML
jgi:hypothetical protein